MTRFGLAVFASHPHYSKQTIRLSCRRNHHFRRAMLSLSLLISLVVLCSTIRTIACENVENNAIRPRNSAPQFKAKSVIDDKFKDISLADYAARGQWVVLVNVLHLSRYYERCLCSNRRRYWSCATNQTRSSMFQSFTISYLSAAFLSV